METNRTTPPGIGKQPREIAKYGTMESPLGLLNIAVTDKGVAEIDFGRGHSIEDFERDMAKQGFDLVYDPDAIQPVVDELDEYFAGRRKTFDVPVDLSRLTPFSQSVLNATIAIPPGSVATYGEIAHEIGKPGASRAVGNALGHNPVPVIVPCHRVVPANRSIGNYTGGVDIKETLLTLEGTLLPTGTLVP